MSAPLLIPSSIEEAVAARRESPDATVLAGGTHVLPTVDRLAGPGQLISLSRIDSLRGVTSEGGRWTIGGMTTVADLRTAPGVAAALPALAMACRSLGSRQVRNRATVGGNICAGGSQRSLVPVLLALDATVDLAGAGGTQTRPLSEVLAEEGSGVGPDEILTGVSFDAPSGHQVFYRIGPRNAVCWATAAVALVVDEPSRTVRLALGGVAPTSIRAAEAEATAQSGIDWDARTVPADVAVSFGEAAAAAANPITDAVATAEYRRHAIAVMARRSLESLFNEESA